MVNCCCPKNDDRTCSYCFSGQIWTTDFSGSDIRLKGTDTAYRDQLFDSSDSVTGKCNQNIGQWTGQNDGVDGFDSHTYVLNFKDGDESGNNVANSLDGTGTQNLVLTETGNSFGWTTPTQYSPDDSTQIFLNQVSGGKLYSVETLKTQRFEINQFKNGEPIEYRLATGQRQAARQNHLIGYFQFPVSALVNNNFTKTLRTTVDLQTLGNDLSTFQGNRFNSSVNGVEQGPDGLTFRRHALSVHILNPFGTASVLALLNDMDIDWTIPISNGDDITFADIQNTAFDDRPVIVAFFPHYNVRNGQANETRYFDTGATFSDLKNATYSLVLNIDQTSALISGDGPVIDHEFEVTLSIPEISFLETETTDAKGNNYRAVFNRCNYGVASAKTEQHISADFYLTAAEFENSRFYNAGAGKAYMLSNTIAATYLAELNSYRQGVGDEAVLINKTISDFRLTDSVTETAAFRCLRAEQIRSGSVIQTILASDYNGFSIPHNTLWEISVNIGDQFKVFFDNLGGIETIVTDVVFDNTNGLIVAVDRTTETFIPFEINSFTFSGPIGAVAMNTTNRLEFTHDQNGNAITSPFYLRIKNNNAITPPPP